MLCDHLRSSTSCAGTAWYYLPITELTWLDYPGVVALPTQADGSCFFHGVLSAFYIPYRKADTAERSVMARRLRFELADLLPQAYPYLSNGNLEEFGRYRPELSVEGLTEQLRSSSSVGQEVMELVANTLRKDILILDQDKQRPYLFGDLSIYTHSRDTVVLAISGGHFSVVGVHNGGFVATLFCYDHPFINHVRKLFTSTTAVLKR